MKPVTDPNILAQLNGGGLKPVTDPAVLAQLNGDAPTYDTAADSASRGLPPTLPSRGIPHTGYAAQVRAMQAQGPDKGGPAPSWAQIGQGYEQLGKGGAIGLAAGLPGTPGDIESLVRAGLSKVSTVSPESALPTSSRVGDFFFGAPTSTADATGRAFGTLASPALLKLPGAIGAGLDMMRGPKPISPIAQAASQARDAGYKLPPNMASENPSTISKALNGLGGKIKTEQLASVKNAENTNRLAAKSIGLPEDQPITEAALEHVRADAGKAYEAVKRAPVELIPDEAFSDDVGKLSQIGSEARAEFPDQVGNPEIDNLVKSLTGKQSISPPAAVDLVRSLRYKAKTNLKNYTSPEKMDLGRAQSRAANAVETLIDRNLQAATTARGPIGAQGGDMSKLAGDLQKARATIAKSYDIESALNPVTGDIDAQKFAALAKKGKPLTGPLQQIGETATAFPKATQPRARFGGNEDLSVLDAAMALGQGAHGDAAGLARAAGWLTGRPMARHFALSDFYQGKIIPSATPKAAVAAPSASVMQNPVIRAMMLQRLLTQMSAQPQAATP